MVKTKEYSPTKRAQTVALWNEGKKKREIARTLEMDEKTVRYTLKRYDGTSTSLRNRPKSGRPRKSTYRQDRRLLSLSNQNRFLSSTDLKSVWETSGGPSVHSSTVRRRLIAKGYYGRTARKKPFISKPNQKKRLKFASEHRHWTYDDWKKVLWTDETKIEFLVRSRKIYVRRASNEAYQKRCMVGTVKHGGGSVMFWGSMAGGGVGTLEPIDYRMTANDYIEILNRNLNPSIEKALEDPLDEWILMQDNDPKHTAKLTTKFFIDSGVPVLEWPPQSPDLNPIEHLWKYVKDDISANGFRAKNKQNLIDRVIYTWNRIAPAMCENLVKSMPSRISAVLKAKGGPTRY